LFAQICGGRCRLHDADLRVRVPETGLATYPDVTVVCGPLERHPEDYDAVTNPTLIVQVLSNSTADYDRGAKFEHYKRLTSMRQYVLVSHLERTLEVWSRSKSGEWLQAVSRGGERASLESIGAELDVTDVYGAAEEPRA
jgi:Uma2 family endonuclease